MTALPRASRSASSTAHSLPTTQCNPSMNRISWSTSGEIALFRLASKPRWLSRKGSHVFQLMLGVESASHLQNAVYSWRPSQSAACQPKAITRGIEQSKSLAVMQHAIPFAPFANETENQSHSASFSSASLSRGNSKRNTDARIWRPVERRNSFIYLQIAARREHCQIGMLASCCQLPRTLPVC